MFSKTFSKGFTLIESIIAMVIIGVGVGGVLLAFTTVTGSSADPVIEKQMVAIAEEMMEEILLKPFTPAGTSPTNTATICGAAAAVRNAFNDVADYNGYQTTGICDIDGAAVVGLEGYSVTITVANAANWVGVVPATDALRVTVIVSRGANNAFTLVGWRTNYA